MKTKLASSGQNNCLSFFSTNLCQIHVKHHPHLFNFSVVGNGVKSKQTTVTIVGIEAGHLKQNRIVLNVAKF
jgi:hypothetical protein